MPPMRIRERGRVKKGTLKRLLRELFKRFPVRLVLSAICIIFNIFANVCSSLFMGLVTNTLTTAIKNGENPLVGSHTVSYLNIEFSGLNVTILVIMLIVIYTIGVLASWFWNRTMAIVTQEYMNVFRKAMFNHMQDLPIKYFDTHAHGAIMSIYTNDIDTIRQFISQSLPTTLSAGLAIIFSFTVMMMQSVWMTLVVVFCALMMLLNTTLIGGRASKYFMKQQRQVAVVEGDIEETIQGLKVIKVFSHEEKSAQEFDKKNDELRRHATTANIAGNTMGPINGNIGNFMYVLTAIMGVLILVVPLKNLSLTSFNYVQRTEFYGIITSFLMLSRMFSNNINNFSQQVTFVVMGMAGASRCFDLIDEQKEVDDGYVELVHVKRLEDGTLIETNEYTRDFAWKHPHKADGTVTYTEVRGDIVLTDVDFGYSKDKTVLHNISIYAHPGQKIAFVGATGAGKTTITNLLNRFYDIADGKIRYDGININKIKKDDLRRSLGIVLQDTNLFTGTVLENIRYGRLDATDEEVYEAAKIANAYDFITRLPEGFNTMLNGDGSNLSQGQRQLLAIARAAVADAPVMILDEATSSIDTRTEKLVQEGMDKLMEGRTVFVIAHRLSTVQNSDAIMVLDHGRIIERGSHKDLIAQKGVYYQLYTGAFELE